MARLIHLNGPPGSGKTTLPSRYVDTHPGTLLVDLDVLTSMLGGWREDFFGALAAVRPYGRLLIGAHLDAGGDVVSQLWTSHTPGPTLADVAREHGARYVEVVLAVDDAGQSARLDGRRAGDPVAAHLAETVFADDALRERVLRHLAEYLTTRPDAVVVETTGRGADECYAELVRVLARGRRPGGLVTLAAQAPRPP